MNLTVKKEIKTAIALHPVILSRIFFVCLYFVPLVYYLHEFYRISHNIALAVTQFVMHCFADSVHFIVMLCFSNGAVFMFMFYTEFCMNGICTML